MLSLHLANVHRSQQQHNIVAKAAEQHALGKLFFHLLKLGVKWDMRVKWYTYAKILLGKNYCHHYHAPNDVPLYNSKTKTIMITHLLPLLYKNVNHLHFVCVWVGRWVGKVMKEFEGFLLHKRLEPLAALIIIFSWLVRTSMK
jgi:hypothetical protein